MDCSVGVMCGGFEARAQIQSGIARSVALADEHLADRIDRHATRNVAGECATHAVRDDEDEAFVAKIEAGQLLGWGIAIGAAGPGLFGRQVEYEEIIFIATSNSANV